MLIITESLDLVMIPSKPGDGILVAIIDKRYGIIAMVSATISRA